jgi:hypothetical protein
MSDPKAESWIRQGDATPHAYLGLKATIYTARLTVDVTPELRARIKVTAFKRGHTVAEVVRDLLQSAFPENPA